MKKKAPKQQNIIFNLLDVVSDAIGVIIKKLNKLLTDKKKSNIVKAIIRVICAAILIVILEIPFFLVGKLGEGILYLCNISFGNLISNIWISMVNYAYLIFSLILLLKIIINMSKNKKYVFEIKESTHIANNLYYTISCILKAIIGISLIPLGLLEILLFLLFGMVIGLLTNGIYVIGLLLIVIGLLIMITFLLLYIHDVITQDKEVINNEK